MTTEEKLAALTKAVDITVERLGAWLTDNTEEVFEEEPEIDGIRCDLFDIVTLIGLR